jgi:DNA-binding LacI/PurR family transcriptional regulator
MAEAGLSAHARHAHSEVTMPGATPPRRPAGDARARPTGIVGVCDEVAIGAIIAARRLGIQVPSALSVVGIDDHEFAEMFGLTTLQQVPREQGAAAVEVLIGEIADPSARAHDAAHPVAAHRAHLDGRPATLAATPT